jgi:hypothetical protein
MIARSLVVLRAFGGYDQDVKRRCRCASASMYSTAYKIFKRISSSTGIRKLLLKEKLSYS